MHCSSDSRGRDQMIAAPVQYDLGYVFPDVLLRELLLWRQDQPMATDQHEVDDADGEPAGHPHHAPGVGRVAGELDVQRYGGDDHGQRRSADTQRAAVWPVEMRHLLAQQDKRERLEEVGEHRAEYRHVQQHAADGGAAAFLAQAEPEQQHHRQPYHAAHDHRHVRGLALTVGNRQELREIAGSAKRIDLPTLGEDNRVETGDQAQHCDQRQTAGEVLAEDGLEAVQQRFARLPERMRTNADHGRIQPEDHQRRDDQCEHAPDNAPGHVALYVNRLLSRQRQLLDGQEQPDREWHRSQYAGQAQR